MSKLFLFITAASLFLTCACQKVDNMPTDSLKGIQNLETKGEVPLNPLDRFAVSLNDAKRYAELYRPGESFVVSPYVEGRDTLLYVFNYKEGWMVLSGDRRTYPVIAQGAKGSIKINETSGYGFSAPYDMLPFSREIVRDHLHMNWGEDGEGDGIYSSLNWYYAEYGCVFSHTDMDTCSLYFN